MTRVILFSMPEVVVRVRAGDRGLGLDSAWSVQTMIRGGFGKHRVRFGAYRTSNRESRAAARLSGSRSRRAKEPLWVEVTLDKLDAIRSDQLGSLRRLAGEGRRAARGIAKATRDREVPDLSSPPWLDPPEPAYYKIPFDIPTRWVRVILDPDSRSWLERVHAAIITVLDSGTLDAWIDRDDASQVVVHLGSQRVGVVTSEHAERYAGLLSAAAHRGELPVVAARLTRRADQPDEHLLELAIPPGSRSPA